MITVLTNRSQTQTKLIVSTNKRDLQKIYSK